jgi:sarcosine oxidase
MIGPPACALVDGARHSAREHGLAFEELDGSELARRFPAFAPADEKVAIWEPRAGILFPERCIETLLHEAHSAGADLRFDVAVELWQAEGRGVRVRTAAGESILAGSLILCAGAWLPSLVPELALPLEVERQVVHYFAPRREAAPLVDAAALPIHIWEYAAGRYWYGLPDIGEGVKVALHHQGEVVNDVAGVRRQVTPDEVAAVRSLVEPAFRHPFATHRRSEVCLYTNTPDGHFLLDRHPEHPQVLLASPCSGHGFKFSILFGEVLAELVEERCERDLELFSLVRLSDR